MKIVDVINYFEEIATTHKAIAHTPEKPKFVRMNRDEGQEGMHQDYNFSTVTLCLEYPQSVVKDALSDNPHDVVQITFHLVQYAGEKDYTQEVAVLDHTKTIGLQIMAKVYEDVKELTLFHGFDRNTISITPVLNYLSEGIVGHTFSFRLTASIARELFFNPTDWL
jgi:hypothetical protein